MAPADRSEVFRLGYRPGLDGIRGLGIALVVVFHTLTFLVYGPTYSGIGQGSFLGVDMFFVLSGFLITSLLLQEWREHTSISLPRFYARRALRLLPVLYVTVIGVALYVKLWHRAGTAGFVHGLLEIFTYTNNFFEGHNVFLTTWFGQVWSLAIEEQFYIVWPTVLLVLLLLLRRRPAALAGVLSASIVAVSLWRIHLRSHHVWSQVYYRTDTRVDELIAGALLAVLLHFGMVKVKNRPWLGVAGIALWLVLTQKLDSFGTAYFDWGAPLAMVAGLACILSVLNGTGPANWFFSHPFMRWLGRLSYTLYLVHIPVYEAVNLHYGNHFKVGIKGTIIANVATLGITLAIHHGIELRANALKSRFSRVTHDEATSRTESPG
jgi:peptidoglycan/LPS O-acetylase OafA/YrhL